VSAVQPDRARDDWEGHWTEFADSAALNPAQDYRRRLIRQLLAAGPGARILDVGSGQGDEAADLLATWPTAEVLGVELSHAGVEIARQKVPGARFLQHDLMEPLDPPAELRGWATHAVCSEVLEHLDRPETLLEHVRPLLAPGARLVVTVPGGPRSAFDRHIGHRRHFAPRDLEAVLARAGYAVERATGAGFPFFNLYRLTVVARGDKLIDDVGGDAAEMSGVARAAMRGFGVLFRANLPATRLGWQIVGVASVPGPQT
jgi:SAM-dependent methyltransferase